MLAAPQPRGPASAELLWQLRRAPGPLHVPVPDPVDPVADEDLQLALIVCYELHHGGIPGVDERWEWAPALLAARGELEAVFERALRLKVGIAVPPQRGSVDVTLRALAAGNDAPALSRHLQRQGTREQLRELAAHRSIAHLRTADPSALAIARLHRKARFAETLRALDLDDRYGAYVNHVPAVTLAIVNLTSLCGLHRRLRGAMAGLLALVELTSAVSGTRSTELAATLVCTEPALAEDVLFGARALAHLEGRWAAQLLEAWGHDASSLRLPLEHGALLVS